MRLELRDLRLEARRRRPRRPLLHEADPSERLDVVGAHARHRRLVRLPGVRVANQRLEPLAQHGLPLLLVLERVERLLPPPLARDLLARQRAGGLAALGIGHVSKMSSGRSADTSGFGTSTISDKRRSTATLTSM